MENLADQIEILKEEKIRLMIEVQEVKKANHEKDITRNENETELDLIQKAVEKNVEVLLGNMTKTSIELVDILEDLNTAKIKNENDFSVIFPNNTSIFFLTAFCIKSNSVSFSFLVMFFS